MTWDGGGTFDRVHNFSADASAGIQAQAARFDAEFDGIKSGLENCQTLTGETTPVADSPMGGFKHTGVAAATSTDNYLRADQQANQVAIYVRDSNATQTGVISASAAVFPTAFTDGQRVTVKVSADASISAPMVIRINGLSANIIDNKGSAALSTLLYKDGVFDLVYDSGASAFRLLSTKVPANTITVADSAGNFTGTDVESVLAELVPQTEIRSVIKATTEWVAGRSASTSALYADSSLFLSLSVGATYEITGQIHIQNASAAAANGIQYRFSQDGAAANGYYVANTFRVGATASTSASELSDYKGWAWDATPSAGNPDVSGITILKVKGIYPVSVSAHTPLRFYWAPNTSANSSIGVAAWSYIKAEKI